MKYKLISDDKAHLSLKELICRNRKVEFQELEYVFNPTKEAIQNPFLYKNMKEGCEALFEVIEKNETIVIVVDTDTDGYCSAAMLINYLKRFMNYKNIIFVMHTSKGHGLTKDIMNQVNNIISKHNVGMVILPDSSSSDYEEHKALDSLGVKVLVIDHHEAEKESEYAIVINNQLNDKGNKTLSGGGMVLKFLQAIDNLRGYDGAEYYYDLAGVALVGDVMMMNVDETRFYVQQGLRYVNNKLLFALYKGGSERNFETISFQVVPVINAFIRIGTPEEKEDLFRALIEEEGTREINIRGQGNFELELAEYISRLGSRIKSRQTKAVNLALDNKDTCLLTENLPVTICILDNSVDKGLTGLIGNNLASIFKKPAIVLKKDEAGYSGSGRTIDSFKNFRNYILESKKFTFALGHQGAFGCAITEENLKQFINSIENQALDGSSNVYLVDRAYFNQVSAYDILEINDMKHYWSRGFEKPIFYISLDNLQKAKVEVIGAKKDTIKITHDNITYIKFKCDKEEIEKIKNTKIEILEMIGTFSVNEWMDRLYPQVIIEDLEVIGEHINFNNFIKQQASFGVENLTW